MTVEKDLEQITKQLAHLTIRPQRAPLLKRGLKATLYFGAGVAMGIMYNNAVEMVKKEDTLYEQTVIDHGDHVHVHTYNVQTMPKIGQLFDEKDYKPKEELDL